MSMCGWTQDGPEWIRTAEEPLGSHEQIVAAIGKAILSNFRSANSGAGTSTVRSQWLKEQVDGYSLATLDEDVRKSLKELFDREGIKVVE